MHVPQCHNRFCPSFKPAETSPRKKKWQIARQLGELRDLDVLQEAFQNHYKPVLPSEEQSLWKPL